MADSFTHLHVHTEYSMLDGAARLDQLVAAAVADGQPALGITDHGNMYGILDFYRACRDQGIKPVLGTEAYMAHDHRSERIAARGRMDDSGGEGEGGRKPWYHLTLLAENEVGYKNLIQLSSRAFMEGYYRKPKVDWELLEEHSEGLIATTGCLGGHVLQAMVPKAIMDPDKQQADPLSEDERFDNAVKLAGRLQDIFGRDNLFVEIQDHGIPAQQWSNPRLAALAKQIKAPLLATNDSHYVHREDAKAHDALLCVQTASLMSDTNRFKFHGDDHYLKSAEEMRYLFRELPTACDNTLWVAERCEVEIEFGKPQLPNFPLPPGFETDDDYLRHEVFEGARKRWGDRLDDRITERLLFELKVISDMGFSSYFLITWDLIKHARENGIRVGPGRGCLHGDSLIWTADGYKQIRDVRVGDEVRTHTGAIRRVSNTFRYDVDEPLVTIHGYSGGDGISMTGDHKVLIRREERETDPRRLRGGAVFAPSVSSPLEWVAARDVRVGDLVCIPRPPSPGTAPRTIDVAPLLPEPQGACEFEVTDDEIIERIPINTPFPHSIREVSRASGVSRNAIKTILDHGIPFDGPLPKTSRHATASERMRDRLLVELRSRGFDSLSAYRVHLEHNQWRTRYPHSATAVARAAGLNLVTLRNVLATYPDRGPIEHPLALGPDCVQARDALAAELRARGFDSFGAWEEHVRAAATTEIRTPRHVRVDDDLLFVLGAFVSDGWIRTDSDRVVGFAERRSELDDTLPLMIKRIWGLEVTRADHATNDLTQTFVRSAAVRALFHHLVPGYEYSALTKHLPEWCGDLDIEQKRTLLAGLWWGDGSTSPERSTYATSSPRLMQQVRDLLWALGAPAGVAVDEREDVRPEYQNRSRAWQVRTTPRLTSPKLQFGWADDEYVYSRVRSIESTQNVEEVFDLEVPEDHSFLTDSYIVHNSAAGCAVAYTLWITDLDPIEYDLLFERFLNPSRISMPDIDMDFDTRGRDEMIRYAAEMYGRENVAQIITFGTIKARQAVRDAARVLGHDYGTGDRIAKAMPPLIMGRDTPLYACLDEHPKYVDGYKMATEIREMYETDPVSKEVIDVAKGLEGLRRSDGIHAAAVVITKDPLTTYLPIQRKPEPGKPIEEAPVVTQYEMHGVEDLGLLKMDFLGLRNLDIITDTLELIEETRGETVDIDNVDLHDTATYELLQRGDTIGVFQLESPPMRALMRSLAPTEFEDVAALVALYRPGPMAANMHNDYADRKNGRKPIEYLHPDAEEVLGNTYGLMVYQESVMRIAQRFAGYSLAEADNLRKACLPRGTKILTTRRGYLPIEKVMSLKDRRVQTIDQITATTRHEEVEDVWSVGVKPVYRLTTSTGYTIEATDNHPFLVEDEWKELGAIEPGDLVAVAAHTSTEGASRIKMHEIELAALLISEGYMPDQRLVEHGWHFTNTDPQLIEAFQLAYEDFFGLPHRRSGVYNGVTQLRLTREEVRDLQPVIGTCGLSAEKTISDLIVNASLRKVERFLGLYFCADGWADSSGVHYATKSLAIARALKRMLLRCSIVSNICKRDIPGHGRHYTVSVADQNEAKRFGLLIEPHLTWEKLRKVEEHLYEWKSRGSATTVGIPSSFLRVELERRAKVTGRSKRDLGVDSGGYTSVRLLHPNTLNGLLYSERLEDLRTGDLRWDTVVSIEYVGEKECFDFRMSNPDRPYAVVEDFLVHNCGKKIRELIVKEREKFESGCEVQGYEREVGKAFFDIIEPFADYAFNRSHAYGYGFIAYQIAYLKANYPAEYMAALLTSVKNNLEKAAVYLAECRAMQIPVTVADINRSEMNFSPKVRDDGASEIVFGLSAVRGVGTGLVQLILDERGAGGPFADFYDFCERVDTGVLNKKTVEALIKAGAFDSVGHPRQGLLMVFESIIDRTIQRRKETDAGIMSLFGDVDGGSAGVGFDEREEIPDVEFPKTQKLAFEKEMLGLYVSDHPLFGAEDFMKRRTDCTLGTLEECEDGSIKTFGGVITNLQRKWTKKGDLMAVFVLEDLGASAETMVFPRTMTEHGHKLADDAIVLVKARVDKRDDLPKLIAMEIEVVEGVSDAAEPLRIAVSPNRLTAELIAQLKEILLDHPGDHPVLLHLGDDKVLRLPSAYGVDAGTKLVSEIRVLLGPDALVDPLGPGASF